MVDRTVLNLLGRLKTYFYGKAANKKPKNRWRSGKRNQKKWNKANSDDWINRRRNVRESNKELKQHQKSMSRKISAQNVSK